LEFQEGNLDLFRLNFAMLTLIPKIEGAEEMKSFKPISLLNYNFKIFSKALTIRFEKVCQRLIAKEHSVFIMGRYILEIVVIADEIVHSIHKAKEIGVIIKLDYEKVYDRVNLEFLLEILESRGFSGKWIGWIKAVVHRGFVSVLANGEESSTFKTGKGLRQGDPLSPLLFNLVVDVLTRMLVRAIESRLIGGLLTQFRRGGVTVLQYADDNVLFSSCDRICLRNLRCVLILFEVVSSMRINFHKSEVIPMNIDDVEAHGIAHVLNWPIGSLPFRYLGVPLHFDKLKREDLQPILDKLIKRIAGWRGRLLAYSSRL
jgi:hypothetical protein